MYNVRGPSKIVAKTRRGMPQNVDNRDYNRNKSVEIEETEPLTTNGPKPVFHKKATLPNQHRQAIISPQHEEIIHFINESWNAVFSGTYNGDSIDHSIEYYEDEPCIFLHEFKPFDLESWWGKRLYAYVTGSENNKN